MKTAYPTKKLGEVATFVKGVGLSKKDLAPSGPHKCILYGQLYTIYGPVIDRVVSKTNQVGKVVSAEGDVLVPATTTADAMGIAVASALNETGIILGGDINVIRTENKILNASFLAYLLSGPFKSELAKHARGTNIIHLSSKDIAKLTIPIPPRQIQEQIAERLNTIYATQRVNEELTKRCDELFRSFLHQIFSSPADNWLPVKLESIASLVRGPFGGSLKKDIFIESGKCVYEQGNVIDNDLTSFRYFISEKKFEQMKRFSVSSGDILMSCSGTIGKLALVPKNFKEGIINQALLKITTNRQVNNGFLKYALENYFSSNIDHVKGGAIKNIAAVRELKKITVPLPPIAIQKEIVAKLSAIQEYKECLYHQRTKLNELSSAVLVKAIAGELVKEEMLAPVKVGKFPVWQAMGAVLQRFERGEMVLAKVLYIAQEIYQVPLGFRFAAQNFGPYDNEIKRTLMAGISTYNRFFTRKGSGVYALGANAEKLFKYRSKVLANMTAVLNDLLPYIKNADSSAIECLATVCKIMQDNKTDDLEVIKQKMYEWKKDKFSAQLIKGTYDFTISKGWDKKLLK